jgi:hypothetical protein
VAWQVTRAAMTAVGLQFIVLQLMASHGLIDVKWDRIKAALCRLIGVEQEGQFSPRDLNVRSSKLSCLEGGDAPSLCLVYIDADAGMLRSGCYAKRETW